MTHHILIADDGRWHLLNGMTHPSKEEIEQYKNSVMHYLNMEPWTYHDMVDITDPSNVHSEFI